MIPELDLKKLAAGDRATIALLRDNAESVGFLFVGNTGVSPAEVTKVLSAYRAFFQQPEALKRAVDMARTGSNRGWGTSRSEQVDPESNPDYKEVFDCGFELPPESPLHRSGLLVYAPNQWPALPGFKETILDYYAKALGVSHEILRGIASALELDGAYFEDKFTEPMALMRGNYYPRRPDWAGEKDFGIAAHTDYGCLTLLATDGSPGLEVATRDGCWLPVSAAPGTFIINFGEMLQIWSGGRVRATPHRVRGTAKERLSIPMFFNPSYGTNVAPLGSGEFLSAGEHLSKRYEETYLHLKGGQGDSQETISAA